MQENAPFDPGPLPEKENAQSLHDILSYVHIHRSKGSKVSCGIKNCIIDHRLSISRQRHHCKKVKEMLKKVSRSEKRMRTVKDSWRIAIWWCHSWDISCKAWVVGAYAGHRRAWGFERCGASNIMLRELWKRNVGEESGQSCVVACKTCWLWDCRA